MDDGITLGDHGVGGIAGRATVGEATTGDTRWAACTKADRVRLNIVRRMVFDYRRKTKQLS